MHAGFVAVAEAERRSCKSQAAAGHQLRSCLCCLQACQAGLCLVLLCLAVVLVPESAAGRVGTSSMWSVHASGGRELKVKVTLALQITCVHEEGLLTVLPYVFVIYSMHAIYN
jgi:hypothetical protein